MVSRGFSEDELNTAAKAAGSVRFLEPDAEAKDKYIPIRLTTMLDDEEVYLGYFNLLKKSKVYQTVYSLVFEKYPEITWEEKKEKIVTSVANFLSREGFKFALITDISEEEKSELKSKLGDFIA